MWRSVVTKQTRVGSSVAGRAFARPFASGVQATSVKVDNPYTGEVFTEVGVDSPLLAHQKVDTAAKVQREWQRVSLKERQALCTKWIDVLASQTESIAHDISGQMGKPLQQARNEVNGTIARAKVMIELSTDALRTDIFPEENGLYRQITHEPVGVVYVIAPWNYPMMTAVNSIIPAILAGNSVIVKHSPRTPLCGEHYQKTFETTGFPKDLLQASFVEHDTAAEVINRPEIGFVSFTGSVRGGREVNKAASSRFIDVTLELGGNDSAYVAPDADPVAAAEGLVDGACYNAGQSCCGIERIFVHESKYDEFLDKAKSLFDAYALGDPFDAKTSLGPMALPTAPASLDALVKDAVSKGARQLTGKGITKDSAGNGRFYSPTLVADCNGSMKIMQEESFGPIVGVEKVKSDEEAIAKMNASNYGLTAAVFTPSKDRAMRVAGQLSAGTVFMNRCDALDPYLPWTGLRDTGKGASLSKYGFRAVTKLKAWNFRV
ncbi:hypothetical protein Poli38472_013881 [Pythium oligandrum]|uniref:Aldehyde dehydrogenase domain-containing protein n=1 Tax=Pythium oligandrum TaxID=41045 RepID=A0A8K1C281_PYTOL|nr:hypothetical protein Poli38472_013881 [Pythium oligandrum]|eukprot:TMW55119.1 hypothetical protein Poli38472_013881 [Pythium oligandrum]